MFFRLNDELFEVNDTVVENSPYLTLLRDSLSNVEYYMDDDKKIYIIPDMFEPDDFYNYIQLISGVLPQDYVSGELLDYMGHINYLGYPSDYWNIKLYDNLIRSNFYNIREIIDDPLFGLEDITHMLIPNRVKSVVHNIKTITKDIYIAGGSAMYMGGVIDDTRDIDIFLTNRNAISDILLESNLVRQLDNCISYRMSSYSDKHSYPFSYGTDTTMQIILREYKTPSEIVHGFDLDCCGYVYHPFSGKLYRTYRAAYSTNVKKNFFDPERSSPSYAIRLSKYHMRGFDIWMPYEDRIEFREDRYEKYTQQLLRTKGEHFSHDFFLDLVENEPFTQPFCITEDDIREINTMVESDIDMSTAKLFYLLYKSSGLTIPIFIKKKLIAPEIVNDIMPHDPVSIIYLMKKKNLFISSMNIQSDYELYSNQDISVRFKDIKPVWKINNPMDQALTGTFYPEPIEMDILDWYSYSPLIEIK